MFAGTVHLPFLKVLIMCYSHVIVCFTYVGFLLPLLSLLSLNPAFLSSQGCASLVSRNRLFVFIPLGPLL